MRFGTAHVTHRSRRFWPTLVWPKRTSSRRSRRGRWRRWLRCKLGLLQLLITDGPAVILAACDFLFGVACFKLETASDAVIDGVFVTMTAPGGYDPTSILCAPTEGAVRSQGLRLVAVLVL